MTYEFWLVKLGKRSHKTFRLTIDVTDWAQVRQHIAEFYPSYDISCFFPTCKPATTIIRSQHPNERIVSVPADPALSRCMDPKYHPIVLGTSKVHGPLYNG